MTDDEAVERLDQLIAMFALVNKDALGQASREIRGDAVRAAILDAAEDWVAAGELTNKVAKESKVSERTVRNRISELLTARALKRDGSGPSVRYRSSGLV